MSNDSKLGELNEAQQAKHADIAQRLQMLLDQNRAAIAAIVEAHRQAVVLLEAEAEEFWQTVYAEYPALSAIPDRLFVAEDGKTILSGFPHSGVPFALFDKSDAEVADANADDAEPIAAAPVEENSGSRIKEFINSVFP